MKKNMENPFRLTSLNHISLVCRSLEKSIDFYTNVLGFVPVRRPNSFNFDGAWLFSYGIGIHLLQSEDPEHMMKKSKIDPKESYFIPGGPYQILVAGRPPLLYDQTLLLAGQPPFSARAIVSKRSEKNKLQVEALNQCNSRESTISTLPNSLGKEAMKRVVYDESQPFDFGLLKASMNTG